ncbi:MAG TPA: hypothetical protein EYH58_05315 [Aquifex aeolicus]|nr:hypothetical protein [Aquifex aeolicus]
MVKKVSIIGGGRIGKLIIKRLIKAYPDIQILASTKTRESATRLKNLFPVKSTTDNGEVLSFSDTLFLCIRPDNLKEFLSQINREVLKSKVVISLLVIFKPDELSKILKTDKVCVFHPTTYLHYSEREFLKSFIIFSESFSKEEKEKIKNFLSKAFGYIEEEKDLNSLKEKIFLYGNFPAYLVDFIEKLILFLSERLKISQEESKKLLMDVLKLSMEEMEGIKNSIATPSGITQRGLKTIQKVIEELLYSLETNTFFKIDKGREKYGKVQR